MALFEDEDAFHEKFELATVISVINGRALTTRFIRFDRLFVAGERRGRIVRRPDVRTFCTRGDDDDSSKGVNREHEC